MTQQKDNMDSELDEILNESFVENVRNIKCGFYKGVWLPQDYSKIADDIENFQVRDDDVWVCSFPKSGTTWTQEMVWCIANNLDFEKAKISIIDRYFYLEFLGATTAGCSIVRKGFSEASKFSINYANQLPSPRFIKTHLPFHLLPKAVRTGKTKATIVYVTRNPKDVCISYYYQRVNTKMFCGTFENYCRLFLENRLAYTPYWEQLISYWKAKDSHNILFLKFEDMKKDLPLVIKKCASFFKKSMTDSQVKMLCDHLSFEKMKINSAITCKDMFAWLQESVYNNKETSVEFIRKGKTEQWKSEMSESLVKKFDSWINENLKDYPDLRAHVF